MTDRPNDAAVYRHFLATLAYRFHRTTENAPADFAAFALPKEVRPPIEIVRHMTHVLRFALETFGAGEARVPEGLPWDAEVDRFHRTLGELDDRLAAGEFPEASAMLTNLQGPFADAMTHVGQLAMIRRLTGVPVRGESFRRADVRIGRVGPDQADPTPLPNS